MRLRDDSGDAQGSRHRFPTYRPRSPNRMESSIRFGIRRNAGKREELTMRVIGNILWIILGGLAIAISWALIGLFLCITIIGIPLGVQAFKMAGLTLTPFGKTVQYGGGVGSTLAISSGWCWSAGGWHSAIWVQACSTASPSSAFRSASSRSKWPSLRSGRSAHRSTVCNNCFCSRSGAAHYHRALHRTFYIQRAFHTPRDLTDSDVRPYGARTMINTSHSAATA